ncbi:hypothetical protein [Sphingosinicella humi]|uniref:Uncharacterized protein n=1 Tax=Allosphingosinicella humi TaxID=2068657 RepID=A0A2U2J2N0_9SPHN|nr:hypothetical protein [Sphingosinicella humi]PWG02552.1 hypothetical protein DF286_06480 [Sphingosinicella humi]
MAKWLHGLMTPLAVLHALPAAAAPPVGPDDAKEIVVSGIREPKRAAAEFVAAITLAHEGQIARFETGLCPEVYGLLDDQKAAVVARLREVAETVGLEVRRPGCRPNLVVTVAADPPDFIRTLHRKRPWLFRDLDRAEIERLTTTRAPGRAWHLIGWRESDGRRAQHFTDTQGEYLDAHLTPMHQFSRLKRSKRPTLDLAFVVLDLPSIVELTLPQLADYVAMRSLAMTRPDAPAAAEGRSILGLFEDLRSGDAPAETLTARDLAYLKALYAAGRPTSAAQQRATMARIAGEELAGRVEGR